MVAESTVTRSSNATSLRPIAKKRKVEESDGSGDEAWDGRPKPFTSYGTLLSESWDSSSAEASLVLELPKYDYMQTNTLAIKATVPVDKTGWAFNICPATDKFCTDILLHFNPRYAKQQLIYNDRQGTWGTGIKKRLTTMDPLHTSNLELVIQIRPEGFLLFANEKFSCFVPHRRPIDQFNDLKVAFMIEDDNGNRYFAKIDQVWWGHLDLDREILSPSVRASMEQAVAEPVASVTNPLVPRTLFISNLPIMDDLHDLQSLEYALLDLFQEFLPEAVVMVRGQGQAYVRVSVALDL